jgi:nitrous oxide reductase accessory protein NosL
VNRRRFLSAGIALPLGAIVVGGACSSGGADGPPEIVLGRTECEQCHMIITELRFAGAYRTPDGAEHRFDDIGDMVEHAQQNGEVEGSTFWVWDYDSEEPMEAPGATFVRSPELRTPMDWALAAFSEPAAAEELAESTGGEVLSWEEVGRLVESGRRRDTTGSTPAATTPPAEGSTPPTSAG